MLKKTQMRSKMWRKCEGHIIESFPMLTKQQRMKHKNSHTLLNQEFFSILFLLLLIKLLHNFHAYSCG